MLVRLCSEYYKRLKQLTPILNKIVWIAALILGKDAGLGIAAIYYRWISLPPPKTFWRYWDFSLPSAEVKPTTISKVFILPRGSNYCHS